MGEKKKLYVCVYLQHNVDTKHNKQTHTQKKIDDVITLFSSFFRSFIHSVPFIHSIFFLCITKMMNKLKTIFFYSARHRVENANLCKKIIMLLKCINGTSLLNNLEMNEMTFNVMKTFSFFFFFHFFRFFTIFQYDKWISFPSYCSYLAIRC